MTEFTKHQLRIPDSMVGERFDKALAGLVSDYSRSTLQNWIKSGFVVLDDEIPKQKDKVYGGEIVELMVPEIRQGEWHAQDIPLSIVYEDAHLLVVNKPAGLVVHPGAGNPDSTLLNAVLFRYPDNRQLPRAGIVHRLDKDTSGLMVVAKTETARLSFTHQLVDHSLHREYLALVHGRVISGATVDEPIARDKHDRRKMSVNTMGKEAVTHYRVEARFRHHTLLRVQLETGRTHQIRVHMSYLGYPLVGDPMYGRRLGIPRDCAAELELALRSFKRQALHASRINYAHPVLSERQEWMVDMPNDMQTLVNACAIDEQ